MVQMASYSPPPMQAPAPAPKPPPPVQKARETVIENTIEVSMMRPSAPPRPTREAGEESLPRRAVEGE